MANRYFNETISTFHKGTSHFDCNFVVDSTNGNGLGIRSLKGPGVANVYMHTNATPATGNPNPAVGIILVQFQDNWPAYLAGFSGFVSPVTGSALTSTTATVTYVIVSLGTTTTAQWVAAGVPVGTTPAVGVSFVAIATGAIGGTGAVEVPGVSGITSIEVIGDPQTTINPTNARVRGGYMLLQCLAPTVSAGAFVSPYIPTAPANNSVIGLSFIMNNSTAPGGKSGVLPTF